jgi:dipeptidyl aminopeptidase/acylaminoacyl peptidase
VYYDDSNDLVVKKVSIDGGMPETVPGTGLTHINAAFRLGVGISPDGKLLALLATRGRGAEAVQKDAVHSVALVSLDAGQNPSIRMLDPDPRIAQLPVFVPDGTALTYSIRENGVDNMWLQPLDGSRGRQITSFQSDAIRTYRFSPDGKTLGVLRSHTESDAVLLRDSGASR